MQRTQVVGIRFTRTEHEAIKRIASKDHRAAADWLHLVVCAAIAAHGERPDVRATPLSAAERTLPLPLKKTSAKKAGKK